VKITLSYQGASVEWDSSMLDDRIELNQIARDISEDMDAAKIIRRHVDRNQHMMDFECQVCAANEKVNVSSEQTGLFEEEMGE